MLLNYGHRFILEAPNYVPFYSSIFTSGILNGSIPCTKIPLSLETVPTKPVRLVATRNYGEHY